LKSVVGGAKPANQKLPFIKFAGDDLLVENVPKKPVGSQRTKWTDGEFDTLLDQAIIHKVLSIALYFVRNTSDFILFHTTLPTKQRIQSLSRRSLTTFKIRLNRP